MSTTPSGRPFSRAAQLAQEAHAKREESREFICAYDEDTLVRLVVDEDDLPVLDVADVLDDGEHVGVAAIFPWEALTWTGLDVYDSGSILELTGTREEMAKAAKLFFDMGRTLMAHVDVRVAA